MKKIYTKVDKSGRICELYWMGSQSLTTPEELKPTLNHFRGRQLKTSFKECIEYAKLSLEAQQGNVDAIEELNRIHYEWNN